MMAPFKLRPATAPDLPRHLSLGLPGDGPAAFGSWDEALQNQGFASEWETTRAVMVSVGSELVGTVQVEEKDGAVRLVDIRDQARVAGPQDRDGDHSITRKDSSDSVIPAIKAPRTRFWRVRTSTRVRQ